MAVFRSQHSSAGLTEFASFPASGISTVLQIGNNRASDGPALATSRMLRNVHTSSQAASGEYG